jgi:hypothetical protein
MANKTKEKTPMTEQEELEMDPPFGDPNGFSKFGSSEGITITNPEDEE